MEISAPSYVGSLAVSSAQAPEQNPTDITQVNPAGSSDKSDFGSKQDSQATENTALARQIQMRQDLLPEKDRPAGPLPSFEVSFLEVEQDLKTEIARMEAARSQERDAPGVTSEAPPKQTTSKVNVADALPPAVQTSVQAPESDLKTAMGIVFMAQPSSA